jgi:flavin-dependent thymidylate synthase
MTEPSTDVSTYVDKSMFPAEPIERLSPSVRLLNATPDPLGSIAAACRMYEGKRTISLGDISDKERERYWEQVQKTHLKAPMEFVDLHFFIEGVTRAFTHQMVRQRTAVYAQESMRFAVKENLADEVPYPPSLTPAKRDEREAWDFTMKQINTAYNWLIAQGVPAEDARGLLPHSTLTRLHYKTNLRNLLEHAGNRLCTQAQFEWRQVFLGIVGAIHECDGTYFGNTMHVGIDLETMRATTDVENEHEFVSSKWQWEMIAKSGVFKPVCFQVGHCPFNADFDRGCTIRPRVEEGKFDQIDPAEYMSDPTAAYQ